MNEEAGAGEPVYLELADALELYAAIIGGTVEQAPISFAIRALSRVRWGAHAPMPTMRALAFAAGTTPEELAPAVRECDAPDPLATADLVR